MSGYLKHLYEEMSLVIVTKWEAVYVVLAKAGMVLLVALLVWAVFRWIMKRVRKRIQQNESVLIQDQVFDLIERAVSYILILGSGMYLLNLFRIPAL